MIAQSCKVVGAEFVVSGLGADNEPGEVRFPVGTPVTCNGCLMPSATVNLPNWLAAVAKPFRGQLADGTEIEVMRQPARVEVTASGAVFNQS